MDKTGSKTPARVERCDVFVAGGGFGWLAPPPRDVMEAYWRGTRLVPGRTVIVGRLDGVIAGSAQLNRPRANAEAHSFSVDVTTFFVAPWARGHALPGPGRRRRDSL